MYVFYFAHVSIANEPGAPVFESTKFIFSTSVCFKLHVLSVYELTDEQALTFSIVSPSDIKYTATIYCKCNILQNILHSVV